MDPEEYAKKGVDKVYLDYNWLPDSAVQRGSIKSTPIRGDPQTNLQLVSGISKLTHKKFRFVKEEEIFSPFRKSCKVVACVKLSNKWRQLKNTACEKWRLCGPWKPPVFDRPLFSNCFSRKTDQERGKGLESHYAIVTSDSLLLGTDMLHLLKHGLIIKTEITDPVFYR